MSIKDRAEKLRNKIRRRALAVAVSAVGVASLAPAEANAQNQSGNPKVSTEYTFNASTGRLERTGASQQGGGRTITYEQAVAQQSRGEVASGRQTAQEIFQSLPSYTRRVIQENGYQILPEFQGGKTTGLNRPKAGVVYACAVQDPSNMDNVMLIPGFEGVHKAGESDFTPLECVSLPKEEARYQKDHHTGYYAADPRLAQTRANELRDRREQVYQDQEDLYLGDQEAEIRGRKATRKVRETRKTAEEVIREGENVINDVRHIGYVIEEGGRTFTGLLDLVRGRNR